MSFVADKKFLNEKFGQGCGQEGCDCKGPLFIRSRCCGANPEVAYDSGCGALFLACAECHNPIMAVPVAELPEEEEDDGGSKSKSL